MLLLRIIKKRSDETMNTKQYLGGLLVLMISGFLGGAVMTTFLYGKQRKVISAQEFRLVDSKGKTRGVFDIRNGIVGLDILDAKGTIRAGLALGQHGIVGLEMYDAKGNLRAGLALGQHGSPGLEMFDAKGTSRAMFLLTKHGSPDLEMDDAKGTPRAKFFLTKHRSPMLGMFDAKGTPRAFLFLHSNGRPTLEMDSADGKDLLDLGAVNLRYTSSGATEHRRANSIVLFRTSGRVLWEAPNPFPFP